MNRATLWERLRTRIAEMLFVLAGRVDSMYDVSIEDAPPGPRALQDAERRRQKAIAARHPEEP